ncbi:MAG TPA: cytochrome c3 family protein [Fimbriimonadaceae bacterium]|nr:cytochrome c3 family protein [Fimbriimonadaceae bacterium]
MAAQVFRERANTVARLSLVAGAITILGGGFAVAALSRSPANTKVGVPKDQPIPFSHKHHAWELGIDCRYCHTSVEKSAYPGLPPSETCMSCHSQIWTNSPLLEPVRQSYETGTPIHWTQVNKVPEFVYFNHSIHIARGLNCNTCHGPVQDMQITYKGNPFQMAWCLQCHRAPERYLHTDPAHPERTPRQQVFDLYWKIQAGEELNDREKSLAQGEDPFSDKPEDIAEGKKLVKKMGVRVAELADCWICHR